MSLLKDRLLESVTDWEIANNRKFNYSAMGRLCGASKQAIQGWKTGDTKLIKKTSTLMCVAKYLSVDPLWLNEGLHTNQTEKRINELLKNMTADQLDAAHKILELFVNNRG